VWLLYTYLLLLQSFIDTCIYVKTLCAVEDTGYFESCFFNPHKSWVRRQATQFGTKIYSCEIYVGKAGEEIAFVIVQWRYLWCNYRTYATFVGGVLRDFDEIIFILFRVRLESVDFLIM
jgi:hypothetical protein